MSKLILLVLSVFTLCFHASAKTQGPRRFLGIRLSQVDSGSIYEKAGLKVGDLVKALNGKAVTHPDDLKEIPILLKRDKIVHIQIERGGRRLRLHYRLVKR